MFEIQESRLAVITDPNKGSLGSQIMAERKEAELTRGEVADKADVHLNTVYNIERDLTMSLDSIVAIADALDCDVFMEIRKR